MWLRNITGSGSACSGTDGNRSSQCNAIPSDAVESLVAPGTYKVADLLVEIKAFASKGEARRMVQNGVKKSKAKRYWMPGGYNAPGLRCITDSSGQKELLQGELLMVQDTLILGLNPAWQRLFLLEKFLPGDVNRLPKAEEYASGKGINCGRVLQLLGGSPIMAHFLGSEHGVRIFDEVAASGIRQIPVWINAPTRICTTIVSKGQTTELIEPSPKLTETENEDFIQTIGDCWLKYPE
jgi:hypothetical protein